MNEQPPEKPQGKRPTGRAVKHDWNALKAEFFRSNMTLNQLKIKYKLGKNWFYKQTKGWREERDALRESAFHEIKGEVKVELRDQYAKFADQAKKLLEVTNAQLMHIYRTTLDKEGKKVVSPMTPGELYTVVQTLSAAVKTFRMMEGKAIGDGAAGDEQGKDYWLAVCAVLNSANVPLNLPAEYQGLIEHGKPAEQPEIIIEPEPGEPDK